MYEMQGPRVGGISVNPPTAPASWSARAVGDPHAESVLTTGPGHQPEVRSPGLPALTPGVAPEGHPGVSAEGHQSCLRGPPPRRTSRESQDSPEVPEVSLESRRVPF